MIKIQVGELHVMEVHSVVSVTEATKADILPNGMIILTPVLVVRVIPVMVVIHTIPIYEEYVPIMCVPIRNEMRQKSLPPAIPTLREFLANRHLKV